MPLPRPKRMNSLRIPLLKLAKRSRFGDIARILQQSSNPSIHAWIHEATGNPALGSFRGETTLHLILIYRPPVTVVDLLIQHLTVNNEHIADPGNQAARIHSLFPEEEVFPEQAVDIKGRTPLHIAVASGCDPSVILRLMQSSSGKQTAFVRDVYGRLPLHWACQNASLSGNLLKNMAENITILTKMFPSAVQVTDKHGFTPLQLAKLSGAGPRILALLVAHEHPSESEGRAGTNEPCILPRKFRDHPGDIPLESLMEDLQMSDLDPSQAAACPSQTETDSSDGLESLEQVMEIDQESPTLRYTYQSRSRRNFCDIGLGTVISL